ncbi:MAG: hypothetical protein ACI90V_013604 [Bacillariaceae sp.]|jgi:hypothetical protein
MRIIIATTNSDSRWDTSFSIGGGGFAVFFSVDFGGLCLNLRRNCFYTCASWVVDLSLYSL